MGNVQLGAGEISPSQTIDAAPTAGSAAMEGGGAYNRHARGSQLGAEFINGGHGLVVVSRRNAAIETAALVLPAVGTNFERHPKLQKFMLANDSVTIAIEVPIWLAENDIAAIERRFGITLVPHTGSEPRVVAGHIDFLQIRNGAVHILDYKPDARTNKPFAQLATYALALSHMTGIPLFDFKCAWFNETDYCEFFPRTILARGDGFIPNKNAETGEPSARTRFCSPKCSPGAKASAMLGK